MGFTDDKELQEYRDVMQPPDVDGFEDGFNWKAVAGALFLGSVIAAQWPGSAGAAPVYYQSIEMAALLVLAAVGAGRFAGLDFFLYALRMRCCPPSQGNDS